MPEILSYGGGTQTIAMCILVARGVLPKPDAVIAADTGREMPSTWEYAERYARPLIASVGLELHIASHEIATYDLYTTRGDLLIPAHTKTGKLSTFCSGHWKADVVERYANRTFGIRKQDLINWIGFSLDEKRRVKGRHENRRYPLIELSLTREDCYSLIQSEGLPLPNKSRCFMCPFQHNAEWREVRAHPDLWAEAIQIDETIRETYEQDEVYVHAQRVPLTDADLDVEDRNEPTRQCGLGMCFV